MEEIVSCLGFWFWIIVIFGVAHEVLIFWIFRFLSWRKELDLINEGQIGSCSVFFVFRVMRSLNIGFLEYPRRL
ncbi:hypothetical protein U1Q18_038973, partial [Sarracenia purpurea var. burkii]